MAYPNDDDLLEQQRALLMPQPVSRTPGVTLPGAPAPQPQGMPGTRPGETMVAQLTGAGPPPGYGARPSGGGGGGGQFQVKGSGGGGGGIVYSLPKDAEPYKPWRDPATGHTFVFYPRSKGPGFEVTKVETAPAGPRAPGVPYQDGEFIWQSDKEGISKPISIAPKGTPNAIFEFGNKTWRRDPKGENPVEYDPGAERIPVPEQFGMPPGTTLPRKQVDELVARQYEADQQSKRDQTKREWEEGKERRAADYAAKIADRKAVRDADRKTLADRDAEMVPFNAVRGQLDQVDSLLASGAKSGSPTSLALPLAKAGQALGLVPQGANKDIDMLTVFEAVTKRLANLQHVPGTGNPSNRDAQWILESGPQTANSPRANTMLTGRMRQYMDWAENVQRAKKSWLSGGEDRRLEDFSVDGTDLERIFPQWGQDTFDKRYGKLRDGMVYLDRFGGYQDFNPKAKVMSKLSKDEYDKLPPGTVVIDDDGLPLTK